jgi:hypothetical protein
MLRLDTIPKGIVEIIEFYGIAGRILNGQFKVNSDWFIENVKVFQLSFPLRQSWDSREIRSFLAHRKVGAVMADALEEIYRFYGLRQMRLHGLDHWGGVYNPRLKRGSREPSTHAWAIAIDYLPGLGPYDEPTRIPWPIVDAFLKRGFTNLPKNDGMHFQACEGY